MKSLLLLALCIPASAETFHWQQTGSTDMEKFVLIRDHKACRVKMYPNVDIENFCRVAIVYGTGDVWEAASRFGKLKKATNKRIYADRQHAQAAIAEAIR